MPLEVSGSRHAERGEDEHAPAQEREKRDTRSTVAALDHNEGSVRNQIAHQRIRTHRRMPRMHWQINASQQRVQDEGKGEIGADRGRSRGTEEGRTKVTSASRKSRRVERGRICGTQAR